MKTLFPEIRIGKKAGRYRSFIDLSLVNPYEPPHFYRVYNDDETTELVRSYRPVLCGRLLDNPEPYRMNALPCGRIIDKEILIWLHDVATFFLHPWLQPGRTSIRPHLRLSRGLKGLCKRDNISDVKKAIQTIFSWRNFYLTHRKQSAIVPNI